MSAHVPNAHAGPARAPERVGKYEILLPIASGGMATVYLARTRGHGGFEQDVALKLTHAHLRASVTTAINVGDGRTYSELAADPLATRPPTTVRSQTRGQYMPRFAPLP